MKEAVEEDSEAVLAEGLVDLEADEEDSAAEEADLEADRVLEEEMAEGLVSEGAETEEKGALWIFMMSLAQNAEKQLRFPLSQQETSQFIAEIVLSRMAATEILIEALEETGAVLREQVQECLKSR